MSCWGIAYKVSHVRRNRIGPLAVDGSTTWPFWVMTIRPSATSLLAACLTRSISGLHWSSGKYARAISLGQTVAPAFLLVSVSRIACSRSWSTADAFDFRHLSEQYLISSQHRSHFLRHVIRRPHVLQVFSDTFACDIVDRVSGDGQGERDRNCNALEDLWVTLIERVAVRLQPRKSFWKAAGRTDAVKLVGTNKLDFANCNFRKCWLISQAGVLENKCGGSWQEFGNLVNITPILICTVFKIKQFQPKISQPMVRIFFLNLLNSLIKFCDGQRNHKLRWVKLCTSCRMSCPLMLREKTTNLSS